MTFLPEKVVNRREHMRVRVTLDLCVTSVRRRGAPESETANICFRTKSLDISAGGICFGQKNILKIGDIVEMRTKNCLTKQACLTCEDVYFMSTKHELQPLEGVVMWVTDSIAGVKFHKLSLRNENVISKLVWDSHLEEVRNSRQKPIIF
ncbi:MAG: PilZ domain-containing protein [Deferribacterales bacterium]